MAKRPRGKTKADQRGASRRPARRRGIGVVWLLPALGLALALVAVAAAVHERQRPAASRPVPAVVGGPVPADIAHDLTAIPEATWNRVGAVDTGHPQIVGALSATGTPVVLYVGAEFCPNCAATRWSLVAALERFGTFTGLALSASSATDTFPSTPTLTMLHARYQSRYVALETVELQGNTQDASGQYPPLQRLTPSQAALYSHDDPSGYIPFLLVGGRYLLVGSSFSPALLQGMDWQTIAAGLPLGTTAAARAILGAANAMSAEICAVDGGAPAAVCRSAGVRNAAALLPQPGK
ncbi:MAG TPA: DUF929 family protein [bacterium]|nr:DUF929 family protein [bacterium]